MPKENKPKQAKVERAETQSPYGPASAKAAKKPSRTRSTTLKPLDRVRAFADQATTEELAQVFEADFWTSNYGPDRPVLDGGSQKTGFRSWMLRNPQVTDTDERIEMRRKAYGLDLVAMLKRKPLLQAALLQLPVVQAKLSENK